MASSDSDSVVVRPARPEDCEDILSLIKELARHEHEPDDAVKLDADTLRRDAFGQEKFFHCTVAEDESGSGQLVGYAIYVFRYHSLEGVSVFLEDIYVAVEHRKRGIGSRLLRAVAQSALKKGCQKLDLICYNWNKESVEFYTRNGAHNRTELEGTNYFRFCYDELKSLAAKK